MVVLLLTGYSTIEVAGHELFMSNPKLVIGYNGNGGYRRNTPDLRNRQSVFQGVFSYVCKFLHVFVEFSCYLSSNVFVDLQVWMNLVFIVAFTFSILERR